ncbi:MAG: hypothetical protein P8188_04610 [Gemmatimonadota bacterium]
MKTLLSPRRRLLGLLVLLAACGGTAEAPLSTLPAAGMAGQRMTVVPVQRPGDYAADAEGELVYALERRRGTGDWVFPDELRRALAQSPGLDVPVDALPVDLFLRAEVERVGDPLYGMLRRVAAVTGADRVLIPVGVSFRPADPDAETPVEPAVEVLAGVVEVVSGRVVWLDVAEGAASGPDDPAGLPRAMEALAVRLLPAG